MKKIVVVVVLAIMFLSVSTVMARTKKIYIDEPTEYITGYDRAVTKPGNVQDQQLFSLAKENGDKAKDKKKGIIIGGLVSDEKFRNGCYTSEDISFFSTRISIYNKRKLKHIKSHEGCQDPLGKGRGEDARIRLIRYGWSSNAISVIPDVIVGPNSSHAANRGIRYWTFDMREGDVIKRVTVYGEMVVVTIDRPCKPLAKMRELAKKVNVHTIAAGLRVIEEGEDIRRTLKDRHGRPE